MKPKSSMLSFLFVLCAGATQAQNVEPAYSIVGRDSTCDIFVYSPAPDQGLHIAYQGEDELWHDLGQVVSSDYGQWGREKKMYDPFVLKANDGTWRAIWGVNDYSPCFAVAYSEDLINWRPQDYPIMREKGIMDPVAYQMDNGTFDIYVKTKQGKRYVQASEDFRTFKEDTIPAEADDILWQQDKAEINGKLYQGNEFEIPAIHLKYIRDWQKAMAEEAEKASEKMPTTKDISKSVSGSLVIDYNKQKRISNRLIGAFFEDISYAADGGLSAELLQNGDFEYTSADHKGWNAQTAWSSPVGKLVIDDVNPNSVNNPHYAILDKEQLIVNEGWDGILDRGGVYDFSVDAKSIGNDKNELLVMLVDKQNQVVAKDKIKIKGLGWQHFQLTLETVKKGEKLPEPRQLTLQIQAKKEGKVGVDMVSLMPAETFHGHGFRQDIAQTIADLQPKFMRFPGGCMLHGDGLDNIYNWKETVGPLKDRKPARNIWNYHQSRRIGFYEYFQFCEDIGAQPLPVLAAGVPCQNSSNNQDGLGGQQGGIPMGEMKAYIQDILDLIEWANGDPATSKWARMRSEAGHPAPFNLKMIGIGNEDLISTVFEERYLMISKAIKAKYPNIEIIGTVGPFHFPSSDYQEGWKIAKREKMNGKNLFTAVDEHYYESPGWFVNHQDYYDDYNRNSPKVYLGEYASRGENAVDNALAEALYLCNIERNGDVVEMASYAPLLCKESHGNWSPDMIYFDDKQVKTTPSYEVQKDFSTHSGDIYIDSHLSLNVPDKLKKYVAASVVKDSKSGNVWLKVVNALPVDLQLNDYSIPARSLKIFKL